MEIWYFSDFHMAHSAQRRNLRRSVHGRIIHSLCAKNELFAVDKLPLMGQSYRWPMAIYMIAVLNYQKV